MVLSLRADRFLEDAGPVGWPAAFLVLGALLGLALNALSAGDPALHHHVGSLAAVEHAILFALPLAFLLIVLLRLREPRLYVAAGLALAGAALGVLL
jgi:hypothetical protein